MSQLQLTTVIYAPIARVFDLSRCVSLHKRQYERHGIVALQGKTGGLLDTQDYVLWSGKLGTKKRNFSLKLTEVTAPGYYREEMRKDFFEQFRHDHYFKEIENGTIMIDQISYQLPPGLITGLLNKACAEKTVLELLKERNQLIKEYAEGNNWVAILP